MAGPVFVIIDINITISAGIDREGTVKNSYGFRDSLKNGEREAKAAD